MSERPEFSSLARSEIEALLLRHHVGRLAYSFKDRVDLEPIHYVYADGWLYGRTQPGTKLATLTHNPWAAFEVDEVWGLFDWESVVVRSRVELLDPSRGAADTERYERAVTAIRTLLPDAFTEQDPTPKRTAVFAMHVDDVEGRRATSAEGR